MSAETLKRKAYIIIQNKLLKGELRAGDVISEQTLAAEIGISRTPVREAIGQLQSEGLFDKKPRVGTVVRLPGQHELSDLYEVREALESHAAGKAATLIGRDDLATLGSLHNELKELAKELKTRHLEYLDEAMLHRFFKADVSFHMVIVRAANNKRALQIISEFRVIQRVFEYERLAHGPRLVESAVAQHGAVLAALKKGDRQAADDFMGAHIRSSRDYAMQSFERRSRGIYEPNERPALPLDVVLHLETMSAKAAVKA